MILGNGRSILYFLPEIVLIGTILLVILFDLIAGRRGKGEEGGGASLGTLITALAGLGAALLVLVAIGSGGYRLLLFGAPSRGTRSRSSSAGSSWS
ncbi:MAG: hypothetical protein ABIK65_02025 [Candidatus Eisenbacteria bacterium]